MLYMKKTFACLLLGAASLAQASDALYYQDAAAVWDTSQFLLAASTQLSNPPAIHAKVDFDNWDGNTTWYTGRLKIDQHWISMGLTSKPNVGWGRFPTLASVPWAPGVPGQTEYRDELFGRMFLNQQASNEGERYLVIYSHTPLLGLGLLTYNRSSETCRAILPVQLYQGHFLASAKPIENNMRPSPAEPGCIGMTGKVDTALALTKKPQGASQFETFNYAIVDFGSKQKQLALDNLVFYFAPQP